MSFFLYHTSLVFTVLTYVSPCSTFAMVTLYKSGTLCTLTPTSWHDEERVIHGESAALSKYHAIRIPEVRKVSPLPSGGSVPVRIIPAESSSPRHGGSAACGSQALPNPQRQHQQQSTIKHNQRKSRREASSMIRSERGLNVKEPVRAS